MAAAAPLMVKAAPWLVKGGLSLGAGLLGRKAARGAGKASPEEQQLLQRGMSVAENLYGSGGQMLRRGGEDLEAPAGYFGRLLRGDRAAQSQAIAPQVANITSVYRGAEKNLERAGLQGGERTLAEAELGRERAGQIAGLTTGVQPAAAEALTQVGGMRLGAGLGAAQTAGGIFSSLLGQQAGTRLAGQEQKQQIGESVGNLIFDIMRSGGGGKRGGGGARFVRSAVGNVAAHGG